MNLPDPLGTFLARAAYRREFPSASYALRRRGKLQALGAHGWAVLEPNREPATVQTVYDVASLTKLLCTALLCGIAVENRALKLDAKASSFLPELKGSAAGSASLSALLTHTAGLPAWMPLYAHGRGRRAYFHTLATIPRERRSRSSAKYSDLGHLVLGWLLERVLGHPLDQAFETRIAGPLDLCSTRFKPPPSWKTRCAASERACGFEHGRLAELSLSYRSFPRGIVRGQVHDQNAAGLGGVAGHAGLFAIAAEAALIGEQFLPGRSQLLSPSTCKLFLRPWTRREGQRWALAGELASCVDFRQSPPLPASAVGLVGFTGTSLWIERGDETVYVLLTNRHHPTYQSHSFNPFRRLFHRAARNWLNCHQK